MNCSSLTSIKLVLFILVVSTVVHLWITGLDHLWGWWDKPHGSGPGPHRAPDHPVQRKFTK